jgi:ABC transport system ATP-binding/permease protein
MALLLSGRDLKKTFGARPLFTGISLTVSDGDRLGLIGPNGAGKSTLLQILAGRVDSDAGEVAMRKFARLAYVPQESRFDAGITVAQAVGAQDDPRRQALLSQAGFTDVTAKVDTLSGGWRKRVSILQALGEEPDLLLLDEPTNHLDLEGILWLEKLLKQSRAASIVISHDRYFLENVATHVAELAPAYPSGLFLVKGGYAEFLERKQEYLAGQAKLEDSLSNRVRREAEWLRRGPKARTTKSKARIDSAHALMDQLDDVQRRQRTGRVQIGFSASERQTKKLIVGEGLKLALGGKPLFSDLDVILTPGIRLGLVGPNGSGKTTLMRVLQGDAQPDEGTVERADQLRIVYFAQDRATQINPNDTLKRALCPHGDSVIYQGRPIHVIAWARRFDFQTEQLEQSVTKLSGGERARVQIARLMLQEADVLLLDEPTNDLDISTLETLEESLLEFPGALVLVTHDRYMLDRVSTHVLGLDGDGTARVYADTQQWEQSIEPKRSPAPKAKADEAPAAAAAPKKKLSYIEQREWDGMETRVLEAEGLLSTKRSAMENPAVNTDPQKLQLAVAELHAAEGEVEKLYARWAELEARLN